MFAFPNNYFNFKLAPPSFGKFVSSYWITLYAFNVFYVPRLFRKLLSPSKLEHRCFNAIK